MTHGAHAALGALLAAPVVRRTTTGSGHGCLPVADGRSKRRSYKRARVNRTGHPRNSLMRAKSDESPQGMPR